MTTSALDVLKVYLQLIGEKPKSAVEALSRPTRWATRDKVKTGERITRQYEQLAAKCQLINLDPTEGNILELVDGRSNSVAGEGISTQDMCRCYLGEAFRCNLLSLRIFVCNGDLDKVDEYIDEANRWGERFILMATFMRLQPMVKKGREYEGELKRQCEQFEAARKKGVESRKKQAKALDESIRKMNDDLLGQPGTNWKKAEVRAAHIATKVNLSESYVLKKLGSPRKTSQT